MQSITLCQGTTEMRLHAYRRVQRSNHIHDNIYVFCTCSIRIIDRYTIFGRRMCQARLINKNGMISEKTTVAQANL